VCKFDGDRVMFVVEVATCVKFTDRQTDKRTTDASRLHKLISWNELNIIVTIDEVDLPQCDAVSDVCENGLLAGDSDRGVARLDTHGERDLHCVPKKRH